MCCCFSLYCALQLRSCGCCFISLGFSKLNWTKLQLLGSYNVRMMRTDIVHCDIADHDSGKISISLEFLSSIVTNA